MNSAAIAITVYSPLVAGLTAILFGRHSPRLVARLGALAAGVGSAGTLAMAFQPNPGIDRVSVVLLLLVFGVSAVVQSFAVRYLAGDPRAWWFTAGAGLLTTASAGLMTAGTLIGLAVFWTVAGVALCLLLGMYWHLPGARDGVRRTATAFLIGDVALWAGVALATATWGNIELRAIEPGQLSGPALPVVGCLIAVAALARSAQIPFHRWLPATLTAPTPVSALLHAGVVNAGGILLIRTAGLVSGNLARTLIIVAGAATMVYGALVMLVKPDVKGALVNSTTAQMGFMILTCGLGLWAAALIHLVAHGFYKATLFLSSGSAIAHHRREESLPPAVPAGPGEGLRRAAIAAGVSGTALASALAVVPAVISVSSVPTPIGDHATEQVLLIFAFITGFAAMWGWMQRRPGIGDVALGASFLIPAAIGYVAIVNAISGYLAPDLAESALSVTAVWFIAGVAVLILGALAAIRRNPRATKLQRLIYTQALSAGHIPIPPSQQIQNRTFTHLIGAH